MAITKISSFVADRFIPNKEEQSVVDILTEFIKKYEPECIRTILGENLSALFIAENPLTTPRFLKLLDGEVYYDNTGIATRFIGIRSMLVDYIYYFYMKDSVIQNTGKSTVIVQADGAFNITPAQKMIDAWNSFVEKALQLNLYLLSDYGVGLFPEFTWLDAFENVRIGTQNEFDI